MRIALTGYYGFGNAGDDAILQSIVDSIRAVHAEATITVVTYPGSDLEAVRSLAPVEAVDGADLESIDEVMRRAERLIVGGGGLIQDYLPTDTNARFSEHHSNLGFWTTLAILARARHLPVMTWAIGIGPLSTPEGRDEARLFLSAVDLVTVRDEQSAHLARELGRAHVEVVGDPALLLTPADTDPIDAEAGFEDLPTGGSQRIVVAVRHWGDDDWMSPLAAALDRLVDERDADVIFVPFQHSGRGLSSDALISTRVAARMKRRDRRAVLGSVLAPSETMAAIRSADLVIGMRLHSILFAAVTGVPVVALSYDPKVEIAMQHLGLGDQVLGLETLTADTIVSSAKRAGSADAGRVAELTELAARPARFLETIEAGSVGPLTPVAVDAAMARGIEARRIRIERDDALSAHAAAALERDNFREAYDKLAAEYQTVLDSRAHKAARLVWTLRAQVRDVPGLARRVAFGVGRRVLPPPIRRALRSRMGTSQHADPALTPEEVEQLRAKVAADLERFVAAHRDGPGFVVLPPSIGWNVDLFQRPQQLALAFARLGYGVIYHVEAKFAEGAVGYQSLEPGLLVGYLPDELADLLHAVPQPIYLSYVYNFDWRSHLEAPTTVYEHIDDLEVFEHVYKRDQLDEWHRRALTEADVVAASAMDLLNDVRQQRPDAVLVANGVDFSHFAGDHPRPVDLDMIPPGAPIVGYYGALAEWFDYDLVGETAKRLADHHFVLIGPDYDGTATSHETLRLPNVHWLGTRPYRHLPAYLNTFTVATIPFVVNDVTHAVSPLKLFEYMAGGKPVVTPPLRECARYQAVQIGEGVEGFVAEILHAAELGADPAHVALLKRTARANTWEARARTIVEAVEGR